MNTCCECDVLFPCHSGEQKCIRLPQQKPDAWQGVHKANKPGDTPLLFGLEQDARAWVRQYANGYAALVPLYTAPPQRPWVGLTDEEIKDLWEAETGHSIFGGDRAEGRVMYISPDEVVKFTRDIEAKFREKNT